jgi:hypothetical protein
VNGQSNERLGSRVRRETFRLAAGSLACLLGVLAVPAFVAADVADGYAAFTAVREQVRGAIGERVGTAWREDMFKPAVAAELVWLDTTNTELKRQSEDLIARRSAVRADRDLLQPKIDANARALAGVAAKKDDLAGRQRALQARLTDLTARIRQHNANRCRYAPDNPGACAAYESEKRSLEGEQQDLKARIDAIVAEADDLGNQEAAVQQDAIELASQDRALDQRDGVLKDDEDAFVRSCEEATTHARALLEVVRNPKPDVLSDERLLRAERHAQHQRESDEMGETFATAVGTGAMGGLVKALGQQAAGAATTAETIALAGSRAVAGSAAIALPVADIVGRDMDARSTEVANNTYLLGAYGAALVNLRREGRLHPGDKGYDALRAMTTKLGAASPGSNAEFTLQSLTTTKGVIRNAIEGLAVELTPTPGERIADGFVEAIMTKRIAKSGAKMAAVSVGRGVTEEYVKTLQHDYFMKQPLKWMSESVDEKSRQAAQDALHGDGR